MVCVGFASNAVLVFGVCLLHMSKPNGGLALFDPILAGHHSNVFAAMGWTDLAVVTHLERQTPTTFETRQANTYVCNHGQQYRLLFAGMGNNIISIY